MLEKGKVFGIDKGIEKAEKSKFKVFTMDMANAYSSWIPQNFPALNICNTALEKRGITDFKNLKKSYYLKLFLFKK